MKYLFINTVLFLSVCVSVYAQQAPTDIRLSNRTITENQAPRTTIGIFTTTDPDSLDTHTYTISGSQAFKFQIVGDTLKADTTLDYELAKRFNITVKATDTSGLSFSKDFQIKVVNVNEMPLKIEISDTTIAENSPSNTIIGKFKTTDTDTRDSHIYTLSGPDHNPFSIFANRLELVRNLDFETKNTYHITITSQDWGGLQISKDFTIKVRDINDAPTDLLLSTTTFPENSPAATVIANLTTLDADTGDSHTYTVSGVHADSFNIVGSDLLSVGTFDFESRTAYQIIITTTDTSGASRSEAVELKVTDLKEYSTGNRATDSLALVALYDTTDGVNWTQTWDLNRPLDTWHGVTVVDERVVELELNGNNLRGDVPISIGNLTALKVLNLSHNALDSLPPLPFFTELLRFEVQHNRLKFADLIPNAEQLRDTSHYSPQDHTYGTAQTYVLGNNETVTFSFLPVDADSRYQWYRDGAVLRGQTNRTLKLSNAQRDRDDAVYTCEITNPNLPGLLLTSRPQTVIIPYNVVEADSLALIALYDSTDGPNWNIQWDFNQLVETWEGITVRGNRVAGISLPNNNMQGPMPKEMRDLLGLKSLDISYNRITNLILPDKVYFRKAWYKYARYPVTRIDPLDIRFNNFDFRDITRYFGIVEWDGAIMWQIYKMDHTAAYAPQNPVRKGTYHKKFIYVGDDSVKLDLSDTTYYKHRGGDFYRWHKDKHFVTGATSQLLKIDTLEPDHEGIYNCNIRNTIVYGTEARFTRGGWLDIWSPARSRSGRITSPLILTNDPDTLVVETLVPKEYEILKELYERTDGDNWINSWDTLLNGSHNWHGVELTADGRHVKGLRLQNNNLQDSIPASLSQLDSLETLHLQDNQLVHLPPLANLDSLKDFQIQRNYLHFDDIRPNLSYFKDSTAYSPQWIRDGKRYPTFLNDSLKLGVAVRGTGNSYRWLQHETNTVGNGDSLTFRPVQNSHDGLYHCEVQNASLPSLILRSHYDTLVVKTVVESDSLALIALYDSTDGGRWTRKWDLRKPVSEWAGIRIQKARVRSVMLADNNLVGSIPSEIGDLELDTFEVQNNKIDGLHLPAFLPNYRLDVGDNQLDFGDLEPHLAAFDSSALYLPQELVRAGAYYERNLSGELKLEVDVAGTGNRYQWYFKNAAISGATTDSLDLTNIQFADTGDYFCRITSSVVPDLVLESGRDRLEITKLELDSLALIALHRATDGTNWKTKWDLNQRLTTWHGITVAHGRVSKIDLASNGLTGYLPSKIHALDAVRGFNLSGNQLDSLSDLTDLNRIVNLQVQRNYLAETVVGPNLNSFTQAAHYSPQIIRSGKRYDKGLGGTFTLEVTVAGTGHAYQWFLDGAALSGKTQSSFTIDSLVLLDVGKYHCEVTHPLAPALKRISLPDTLTISKRSIDSLALVALYNSTDGPNWRVKWNLNQPINTWYGVRIKEGRVNELRLFSNDLKGTLPPELGYLDQLTILELSDNQLNGALTDRIGRLQNLHTLNIFENQLSGTLPPELGNLSNLITLDIADNQFTGDLPSEISGLKSLTTLYFMNNDFTGPVPPAIGQLTNLVRVDGENNRLSGTIPPEIGNLINLENLFLCNNELTGAIPPEVGRLTNLQIMYLCENDLSDSIPEEIGNLINLVKLNLAGNELEGALPASVNNLEKLTHLWVANNQIDSIPDLSGLTNLVSVTVTNNRMDFEAIAKVVTQIGDKLEDLGVGEVVSMTIRSGKFYVRPHRGLLILIVNVRGAGNFYQWYHDGEELAGETSSSLTLSDIQPSDTGLYHCEVENAKVGDMILSSIADTLKMLPLSLDSLALVDFYQATNGGSWRRNWNFNQRLDSWHGVSLEGPRELSLTSARVVGLQVPNNNLEGSIPATIYPLSALRTLNLNRNPKLAGFEQVEVLSRIEHLGLANNNLTDADSLDFSKLKRLRHLDLGGNRFEAAPQALKGLDNLETLWLHYNRLEYLPDLSHLSHLNNFKVQHNRLDFVSIRPNLAHLGDSANYSPQGIGFSETYYGDATESVTLPSDSVRGVGHTYKWFYYGQRLAGAMADSLWLDSLDIADEGLYTYEVRNAMVPGLVLQSVPDTLVLRRTLDESDSLALVAFYNATGGRHWKHKWDLNKQVSTWVGVRTHKGRVAELNLAENNLRGTITPAVVRLPTLAKLDVRANNLQIGAGGLDSLVNIRHLDLGANGLDTIAFDLSKLSNLKHLSLADNRFAGAAPADLLTVPTLETLNLAGNKLDSLPDFSVLAQLTNLNVSRNQLYFEDLETNIGKFEGNVSRYSSQSPPNHWSYLGDPSADLILKVRHRGDSNRYQWFYESTELVGETDSVLELKTLGLEQTGLYRCMITNSQVVGLEYETYHHVGLTRTVIESDSLALVALYNNAGGADWNITWDLNRRVSEWFGVGHWAGRVTTLALDTNNLDGAMPAAFKDLTALQVLNLGHNNLGGDLTTVEHLIHLDTLNLEANKFTSLPDLSPLTNLNDLRVGANHLHFADLEPNVVQFKSDTGRYTPQTPLNRWSYRIAPALDFTLHSNIRGDSNRYQWFYEGAALIGETDSSLVLSSPGLEDTGLYHCVVTNTQFIDLEYETYHDVGLMRTVTEQDSLTLIALYQGAGGRNWAKTWDLKEPIWKWAGIAHRGGRVTKVDLAANNLVGDVPEAFKNLTALDTLYLQHNRLANIPDLAALSHLKDFKVQDNYLDFEDLKPNVVQLKNEAANYHPQTIRDGRRYEEAKDRFWQFKVDVAGRGQTYQWFHDGFAIAGQTAPILTLPALRSSHDGRYHCEVRNVLIPDLVLASVPDTLLVNRTVSMDDSLALVALYNSTDGTNWTASWDLNQPVKTWFGVSIDSGRVVRLELADNRLKGTLPPETATLTALKILNLNHNQLEGMLPNLALLKKLNGLYLAHNELEGAVSNLSAAQNLAILHLNDNAFNYLPDLSSLPLLKDARLHNNRFHFADIEPHLDALHHNPAYYSPQAPIRAGEIYQRYLHSTFTLQVDVRGTANTYRWYQNQKVIPGQNRAVLNLPVQALNKDAYFCEVTSSKVPDLTLYSLPDTVIMTDIIVETDSLILVDFYARTDSANWVTKWDLTQPVKTWAGVTLRAGRVGELHLPDNNLKGALPEKLGKLDYLTVLDLAGNQLTGGLPDSLRYLDLVDLNVARNQLTGLLPFDLNQYATLEHLDLSSNQLGGALPATIIYLTNLKTLKLGNNQFGTELPAGLGKLQNLEILDLNHNSLRGTIPSALANLSNLKHLDLSHNRFTGSIPNSLGKLGQLENLHLNHNQLSGSLPSGLGDLGNLKTLDLKYNQLAGTAPSDLGKLDRLEAFRFGLEQSVG